MAIDFRSWRKRRKAQFSVFIITITCLYFLNCHYRISSQSPYFFHCLWRRGGWLGQLVEGQLVRWRDDDRLTDHHLWLRHEALLDRAAHCIWVRLQWKDRISLEKIFVASHFVLFVPRYFTTSSNKLIHPFQKNNFDTHTHTLTHTHTHTHTHTNSRAHSHTHTHTHSLTHSQSLSNKRILFRAHQMCMNKKKKVFWFPHTSSSSRV
jgi:hypothetical protein